MSNISNPDSHSPYNGIEPADPAGLEPSPLDFANPTPLEEQVQHNAYNAARRLVENEGLKKLADEHDHAFVNEKLDHIETSKKALALRRERDDARKQAEEYKHRAEQAIEDELTGVLNRRGLVEAYEDLVNFGKRRRNHLDSILFIDADEFKAVNDTLGHSGGDEVLRTIAKAIHDRASREGDIVGRYGGDEFIVMLPDTDKEVAREIAEEIRQNVENFRALPLPVTVSIGVDSIDREKTLTDTTRYANRAMKEAKDKGRNQVIIVDLDQGDTHTSI